MGQVIAVVSGKGGTGKTSFTALVGSALAEMGHRTLCLDCDVGLRNLDLALGMSDSALMDFTDVIAGRCTLEDAVVQHPKSLRTPQRGEGGRPCFRISSSGTIPQTGRVWGNSHRECGAMNAQKEGAKSSFCA